MCFFIGKNLIWFLPNSDKLREKAHDALSVRRKKFGLSLTAAEGFILGTAAKMFTIAGPVITFGITASVIYGLILCLLQ